MDEWARQNEQQVPPLRFASVGMTTRKQERKLFSLVPELLCAMLPNSRPRALSLAAGLGGFEEVSVVGGMGFAEELRDGP